MTIRAQDGNSTPLASTTKNLVRYCNLAGLLFEKHTTKYTTEISDRAKQPLYIDLVPACEPSFAGESHGAIMPHSRLKAFVLRSTFAHNRIA